MEQVEEMQSLLLGAKELASNFFIESKELSEEMTMIQSKYRNLQQLMNKKDSVLIRMKEKIQGLLIVNYKVVKLQNKNRNLKEKLEVKDKKVSELMEGTKEFQSLKEDLMKMSQNFEATETIVLDFKSRNSKLQDSSRFAKEEIKNLKMQINTLLEEIKALDVQERQSGELNQLLADEVKQLKMETAKGAKALKQRNNSMGVMNAELDHLNLLNSTLGEQNRNLNEKLIFHEVDQIIFYELINRSKKYKDLKINLKRSKKEKRKLEKKLSISVMKSSQADLLAKELRVVWEEVKRKNKQKMIRIKTNQINRQNEDKEVIMKLKVLLSQIEDSFKTKQEKMKVKINTLVNLLQTSEEEKKLMMKKIKTLRGNLNSDNRIMLSFKNKIRKLYKIRREIIDKIEEDEAYVVKVDEHKNEINYIKKLKKGREL